VAAAPAGEGGLGVTGLGGIALLCLVVAGTMLALPRLQARRQAGAAAAPAEATPTLAELAARGQLEAGAKADAAAKAAAEAGLGPAGTMLALPRLEARRQAGAAGPPAEATPPLAELAASGQLEAEAKAEAEARAAAEAELARIARGDDPLAPAPARAATLDRSIFRAYDIRGIVGQTLDAATAKLLGQAIGTVMQDQGARSILVG